MSAPPGFPDLTGPHWHHLDLPSDLPHVSQAKDAICNELLSRGASEESLFAVKLSLEEALVNAVKHGNKGDNSKRVRVTYQVVPQHVAVVISDDGSGFVPDELPDPTLDENIERGSGRGVWLMKAYMTLVAYNDVGNTVYMLKEFELPLSS